MSRIQFPALASGIFSTELEVYQSLINYGGHLDNALMLTLVSETRARFFKTLGYTEVDVEGFGIVVADAAVQYLSEAFHGDILRFTMDAQDFNKYGCDLVYQGTEIQCGREVVRGKTGIVFFDYRQRRIHTPPPQFLQRLQQMRLLQNS